MDSQAHSGRAGNLGYRFLILLSLVTSYLFLLNPQEKKCKPPPTITDTHSSRPPTPPLPVSPTHPDRCSDPLTILLRLPRNPFAPHCTETHMQVSSPQETGAHRGPAGLLTDPFLKTSRSRSRTWQSLRNGCWKTGQAWAGHTPGVWDDRHLQQGWRSPGRAHKSHQLTQQGLVTPE